MASNPKGMKESKQPVGAPASIGNDRKVYTIMGNKVEVPNYMNITKSVGYGAYGFVCAAVDSESGKKVAIKQCRNVFKDAGDCKRVLREVKLLQFMNHENLLSLSHFYAGGTKESFQDVYMVSELMDTDLNTVIRSKQKMSSDHFKYFIYQLLRGLKYIHSGNVMHRDLKPANLLVNINCDLRICDFGLARGWTEDQQVEMNMTDYVVTRWYRPPELLLMSTQYSSAVDIWSVGCIFAEVVNRKPLFPGKDYLAQLQLICDSIGIPPVENLGFLRNKEAVAYVSALPKKPAKTMMELMPTLTDSVGQDFVSRMLVFDPSKRATASDLLSHPYLEALHDPTDEPVCERAFEWKYDAEDKLPRDLLRELFWAEAEAYEAARQCTGPGTPPPP